MSPLAAALKAVLDKQSPVRPPGYGEDERYGRNFTPVLDAMEEAGYELECHQGGISGTLIVAVPKQKTYASFKRRAVA